MAGDCCLWRCVDERHLNRFQGEISVLKFLGRCVDEV